MRVLMLSWEYPPHVVGGLGKHVAELAPALADLGIELYLLTPMRRGGAERETIAGIRVYRIPSPANVYPNFYEEVVHTNETLERACEELLATEGPFELIHNHDWLTSFVARRLKHAHKLPLLATIHATERGRGRGQLLGEQAQRVNDAEWRLTYEAWRVICCTRFMADEIHRYFQVPLDKVDVIPNGVDPTPFQKLEGQDLSAFRARWAQPEEKIVLYVGRVVQEKGAEILVRSAPFVLARVPEAKFIIAGTGPELERLRDLVQELGLSTKVLLPGFIDDKDRDRLYKVADCAVFPSLYEPFGIVALEAMAAKTPVVVSEVGGLAEVVRHAETGITIYPGDVQSCAWGILHTLEHPEWTRQRVQNAYEEVLRVYNWHTIAEQTAKVYRRIVEERARVYW
ncbi:MAG: glycosyltransferase family 4 protein [Chloroflexi bacterium]|nr:glycosyltransferase family 4 protein [Chloroflexota bacterium]